MSDWEPFDLFDPAAIDRAIDENVELCRTQFHDFCEELLEPELSIEQIQRFWETIEKHIRRQSREQFDQARRSLVN